MAKRNLDSEVEKLIKEQRADIWKDKVQSLARKPVSFRSKRQDRGSADGKGRRIR